MGPQGVKSTFSNQNNTTAAHLFSSAQNTIHSARLLHYAIVNDSIHQAVCPCYSSATPQPHSPTAPQYHRPTAQKPYSPSPTAPVPQPHSSHVPKPHSSAVTQPYSPRRHSRTAQLQSPTVPLSPQPTATVPQSNSPNIIAPPDPTETLERNTTQVPGPQGVGLTNTLVQVSSRSR